MKTVSVSIFLVLLSCISILDGPVQVCFAQASSSVETSESVSYGHLKPGYVSLEGVIRYEDVEGPSAAMAHSVALLRSGQFALAEAGFRAIQRQTPKDALAYRGENEAARRLDTLDQTIARYRNLLASVTSAHQDWSSAAVLRYALADAILTRRYTPSHVGDAPSDMSSEPKTLLVEAIRLKPDSLVAYLDLAAYYEYPSLQQGTLARQTYDQALRLRPDLYQLRYLHAASWDRPGFVSEAEKARLHRAGLTLDADRMMMPQIAIRECLALIQEHPNFAPPYYRAGSDYAFPLRDYAQAKKYLALYLQHGERGTEKWKYAEAEVASIK